MTLEKIDALRDCVRELIEAYHTRVGVDSLFEDTARNALDALCEAAKRSAEHANLAGEEAS